MAWFCSVGVPIALFDDNDSASLYHRPGDFTKGFLNTIQNPTSRKRIVRCHYSRDMGMRLAVDTLREYGHTSGALVNCLPTFADWVHHRAYRLRYAARSLGVSFSVYESRGYVGSLATAPDDMTVGQFAGSLRTKGGPCEAIRDSSVIRDRSDLPMEALKTRPRMPVNAALALIHALSAHRTTAVIAPNDVLGNLYHHVLDKAGVRIPEDISLISFDANPVDMYPYSLTSVDFGFDYLGYQAFHYFLGDRRVPIRKHRSLPGLCRLTHTLTVGPPAQGSS
jgi:DNA-binding LacI/PurR family transcriptional regulator